MPSQRSGGGNRPRITRSAPAALPTLLIAAALALAAGRARGQDFERMSPEERENYHHFQLNLIGREPAAESFVEGYEFIRPLYEAEPQSEAYRICYAQAISGFPAGASHAPLHGRAIQVLGGLDPEAVGASEHLSILLMCLLERLTEDGELVRASAMSAEGRLALLRADAVAAAIFSTTLARGTWHATAAGSEDWSIRPGMLERRSRLETLPADLAPQVPDWRTLPAASWLGEAADQARVLAPTLNDPGAFSSSTAP